MGSVRFIPAHTRKIAGIAALMLVAASVGVAAASIPGPLGVISSCYEKNGDMKIIDSAKTCPKGTVRLEWNQAGAPGAPGAPGEPGQPGGQGEPGAQGATGAAGAEALAPIKDPEIRAFWLVGTGLVSRRVGNLQRVQLSTLTLSNPHVTPPTADVSLTLPDSDLTGNITSEEGPTIEGELVTPPQQAQVDLSGDYRFGSTTEGGQVTNGNGTTRQGGTITTPESVTQLDIELSRTNEQFSGTAFGGTVTGTIEFPVPTFATVQLLLTAASDGSPSPTCPISPLNPNDLVLGRFVVPSGQTVSVPLGEIVFESGAGRECITVVSDDPAVQVSLFGSIYALPQEPEEPPEH
jgi:hypothetical protein